MQGFTTPTPIDTDPDFTANSDQVVPSQKAVKTAIDTKADASPAINDVYVQKNQSWITLGQGISEATAKATPNDGDGFVFEEGQSLKRASWLNLKNAFFAALGGLTGGTASLSTLVDADSLPVADSNNSNTTKKLTWASLKSNFWTSLGGLISTGTVKTTPTGADGLVISDSASSNATKMLSLTNLALWLFGSSALTGTPTAPTAAAGTNTTQVATTAFVTTAVGRFLLAFASYNSLGSPISTSPAFPYAATLPSFTIYPKQWSQGVYIGATNNATNYWLIELLASVGGVDTVVASVNTSALGTNAAAVLTTTTFNPTSLTQASNVRLAIRTTKAGSGAAPSNLSCHGPSLEYGLT